MPGNGELFTRESGGGTMKDRRLIQHRALDDAFAERFWLTNLDDIARLIYDEPRRPTAVSLAALEMYYNAKRARMEYLRREGRSE